jgi:hypothetical protein
MHPALPARWRQRDRQTQILTAKPATRAVANDTRRRPPARMASARGSCEREEPQGANRTNTEASMRPRNEKPAPIGADRAGREEAQQKQANRECTPVGYTAQDAPPGVKRWVDEYDETERRPIARGYLA